MTKDLPPYGVGRFLGRYRYLEILCSSLFFDGGTTVSRASRTDSSSYVASHRPPAEFCLVEGEDPGVACGFGCDVCTRGGAGRQDLRCRVDSFVSGVTKTSKLVEGCMLR